MHVIVNFYAPKEIDAIVNMLCQDRSCFSARESQYSVIPYIRTPYVHLIWKEREKLGPSNSAAHPLRMINTPFLIRMITFHNYSCKNHNHYHSVHQAPNSPFIMPSPHGPNRVFCIVCTCTCTYYSSIRTKDLANVVMTDLQRSSAGTQAVRHGKGYIFCVLYLTIRSR